MLNPARTIKDLSKAMAKTCLLIIQHAYYLNSLSSIDSEITAQMCLSITLTRIGSISNALSIMRTTVDVRNYLLMTLHVIDSFSNDLSIIYILTSLSEVTSLSRRTVQLYKKKILVKLTVNIFEDNRFDFNYTTQYRF